MMDSWLTEKGMATGYLALPEEGKGPGILLLHAWWGLTDFFKELADKLAAEGFVVLAPDLYHDGKTADTIDEAEKLVRSHDDETTQVVAESAVDHLMSNPAVVGNVIGTIGFSFGAAWALWLASGLQPTKIGTVVVFYGNYADLDREDYANAQAAFLGHFAEDDPYEEPEYARNTLDELHAAGREANFYFYPGTGHWFFEHNRPDAYDAEAAELAWERTIPFLKTYL
ncbi:MAG: dienelactone hydrolase family protein [Candidatus Promineifilaceae bacterium]